MSGQDDWKRPVRSYVIRSGRMTTSQRDAIENHWQEFVLDFVPEQLPLSSIFPNAAGVTIEIGFGMGDSLLAMAAAEPADGFLGIEVHRPGVGKLLQGAHKLGLSNLKIICHDAVEVLTTCFAADSIDRILILFPDPWPKKKHHKRRLVQADFVSLLASRLKPGGRLHLASDWEPYAVHMLEVLEQETALHNANGAGQYWAHPDRPETKFEARGKRLGHGVWDLLYIKSTS